MKKLNYTLITLALIFIASIFTACYTPSPLYGTWTDNDGNKIIFKDDETFNATIINTDETKDTYEGTWMTIDNILTLHIKGDNEYTRITEWDLQGARLNLTWTASGSSKILTLWHTARK